MTRWQVNVWKPTWASGRFSLPPAGNVVPADLFGSARIAFDRLGCWIVMAAFAVLSLLMEDLCSAMCYNGSLRSLRVRRATEFVYRAVLCRFMIEAQTGVGPAGSRFFCVNLDGHGALWYRSASRLLHRWTGMPSNIRPLTGRASTSFSQSAATALDYCRLSVSLGSVHAVATDHARVSFVSV